MKKKKEKMKTVPFRKYFYECSCSGEGLITDEDENSIYVSLWKLGFGQKSHSSLRERLRWAWNLLTKGTPDISIWTDYVMFTPDTAIEISEDLFARGVRLKQTSTLNKKVKKNVSKKEN